MKEKAKKTVRLVTNFMMDKVRTYMEPSERKVDIAKLRVEEARLELKKAEEEAKVAQQTWVNFRKEYEHRIKQNEMVIERLKKRMENAGEQLRSRYNLQLFQLERK